MSQPQNSPRSSKEKGVKLRFFKSTDRNANSDTPIEVGGTIRKPAGRDNLRSNARLLRAKADSKASKNNSNPMLTSPWDYEEYDENNQSMNDAANYMQLNFECGESFFDTTDDATQFRELFCDFPHSYDTSTIVTSSNNFMSHSRRSLEPPPYREPSPPTPPPISQMPTRNLHEVGNSLSAPATPSRGKVVLSKKERKELHRTQHKLLDVGNGISIVGGYETTQGSESAQNSPYKGRVNELKNCIAKINLFASLNRHVHKSNASLANDDHIATHPEVSPQAAPPPPAPDTSPPQSAASNNNDVDYTEKLRNLPVRQRKAHVSHMDNYCLFDPVDFINEKTLRKRKLEEAVAALVPVNVQMHGLRDPLFSSRQHLDFSEEEMVPEVIYDDQEEEVAVATGINYDHHNYFVIDPDSFEAEPGDNDVGIPNPFTNEQLIQAKLESHATEISEEMLKQSISLDRLLYVFKTNNADADIAANIDIDAVGDADMCMSHSQESKEESTATNSNATNATSTALEESSTSSNSTSSTTSATASNSQTTLRRTKKKLSFRNLSPFRASSPDNAENRSANALASELASATQLQHISLLLLGNDLKENSFRSRTVPLETNYVLFNPGPVPSRNVQYKIRKPRPLSTHSDADSGFLSPCSPDELSALKFTNPAILVLQQCDSVQGYIEVILKHFFDVELEFERTQ